MTFFFCRFLLVSQKNERVKIFITYQQCFILLFQIRVFSCTCQIKHFLKHIWFVSHPSIIHQESIFLFIIVNCQWDATRCDFGAAVSHRTNVETSGEWSKTISFTTKMIVAERNSNSYQEASVPPGIMSHCWLDKSTVHLLVSGSGASQRFQGVAKDIPVQFTARNCGK